MANTTTTPNTQTAPNAGDMVRANWGAMLPTWEGEIVVAGPDGRCLVKWADCCESEPTWVEVHAKGYRSANGSPIGVTLA